MNVPEQIRTAARGLIEQYGESFDYLGSVEGQEAYLFKFPDDSCTGYPFVFLFKGGKVSEITGPESFNIIDSLTEDIEEGNIE